MALGINSIFNESNRFELEDTRSFTKRKANEVMLMLQPGINTSVSATMQAYGLANSKNDIGFEITYTWFNFSGVEKTSTITLTNETEGTTLRSDEITLNNGGFRTNTAFFSLEKVKEGDSIKIQTSGDDIKTISGSFYISYIKLEVVSIQKATDESD